VKQGIGKTNTGKVRKKNEDTIYINSEKVGVLDNLFIVADGMGGHKAGEVASRKAIEAFCAYVLENYDSLLKDGCVEESRLEEFLKNAALKANKVVYELQVENMAWNGMGTTLSACVIRGNKIFYAHIGDSRIYAFYDGKINQVSLDHSLVAEMQRLGRLTEEEARNHPNKNVLIRAVGTDLRLEVETGTKEIPDGTKIMLCSDGLTDMVSDEDILTIMNSEASIVEKPGLLVDKANENGGKDNISVVIIH